MDSWRFSDFSVRGGHRYGTQGRWTDGICSLGKCSLKRKWKFVLVPDPTQKKICVSFGQLIKDIFNELADRCDSWLRINMCCHLFNTVRTRSAKSKRVLRSGFPKCDGCSQKVEVPIQYIISLICRVAIQHSRSWLAENEGFRPHSEIKWGAKVRIEYFGPSSSFIK